MPSFERHIFLCINERGAGHPRGCCSSKGGQEVAQALKIAAYHAGLKGTVRVNKAMCLDACELGAAAVVYPEGYWYQGLTVDDVDEIVETTLIRGEPIERLLVTTDTERTKLFLQVL